MTTKLRTLPKPRLRSFVTAPTQYNRKCACGKDFLTCEPTEVYCLDCRRRGVARREAAEDALAEAQAK